MPHLSPMNWIMALLTITILLMLYTTATWWNHKSQFSAPMKSHTMKAHHPWKW